MPQLRREALEVLAQHGFAAVNKKRKRNSAPGVGEAWGVLRAFGFSFLFVGGAEFGVEVR